MWKLNKYSGIAVIDDLGNKLSYKQLYPLTKSIGGFFSGKNLILCLCSNTVGSLLGYISFINTKQVPIMLNSEIDKIILDNIIIDYKPNYIWAPTNKENLFVDYEIIYQIFGYSLLKLFNSNPIDLYNELALLLTTSGSTGSPKLVRQSYTNILENTKSIIEYLSITEDERAITTLPMNYTYGLSIINTHLYAGATILLTNKSIFEKEFWTFLSENKATSFGGVPYTYEMLDKMRFYRMDLPHLKTMTQAGGKLSPELHKKLVEYSLSSNKKFFVMYGQTEATARMAYLPFEKSLEKNGSMGIAIPGGAFKLIDNINQIIQINNVVGELLYEGKNVALGYAENLLDLNKGDEFNGRLFTGDMALRDNDGYFYIVGRKKRFLKVYGNRVNLDELERLIKSNFEIDECACAGKDDEVYVFISPNIEIDKIYTYLVEKTKINRKAFKVLVIDSIPKNESGKVLYNELIKYYEVK
jgi:acyl-coenzyme A synthetase/AMP-(fatty) acid ligase